MLLLMHMLGTSKRIVVFSPLYPPHVGGLERHAQQWNQHMAAIGHRITVWTPQLTPTSPVREYEGRVEVIRYPAWQLVTNYPIPKFWSPLFWHQLHSLLTAHYLPTGQAGSLPTIVVSRTRFFLPTLMAVLFATIKHVPRLHIEHGSDFVHSNNPLLTFVARLYDYTFGRFVLRQATMVVANSKASAEFARQLSRQPVAAIIYRGVDKEAIEKIAPASVPPGASPLLTYFGRLISGKGVHDFLNALSLIKDLPWRVWIIGGGPEDQRLQTQAQQLGLGSRITFWGEMSWVDTMAHVKSSDVIINPSYTEGLPTSLIEAALCQRAIVATAVGGTGEVVTDTVSALLVPPGDPKRLATVLRQLLQNRDYDAHKLAQTAFRSVSRQFGWKQSSAAYASLLEKL